MSRSWQANYEKTLLRFETTPQPTITDVRLDLDLHPHAPRLETRGSYVIENRTGAPLGEMHLRWNVIWISRACRPGRAMVRYGPSSPTASIAFDTPMQPGERAP
jgi:ABC-2 type transport system permease protein